jgi:SHS2 domain-containing protein
MPGAVLTGTMPYEFLDHTGDVAVRLRAASLGALFADAARALTATLVEAGDVRPAARHLVSLEAGSPDLLLVDWLNELVYRFDVDRLVVARADVRVIDAGGAWRLDATVLGEPLDEARHPVRVLVKGVTYHQLGIGDVDGALETTVVFDI